MSKSQLRKEYEARFGVVNDWLGLYDDKGNQIYIEHSNGWWVKYEYDAQGNVTYSENSDGDRVKTEYDEEGNPAYIEYSDGDWVKYEYDEEGNVTYHESSSRGITLDKRNNLEGKIVTIDGKEYQLTKVK
jgi:YD repeat-containing protein